MGRALRAAIFGFCLVGGYLWYLILSELLSPSPDILPSPPAHEEVLKALEMACWADVALDAVVPALRRSPMYPSQAELKGIEGWVELSFAIRPDGRVQCPAGAL